MTVLTLSYDYRTATEVHPHITAHEYADAVSQLSDSIAPIRLNAVLTVWGLARCIFPSKLREVYGFDVDSANLSGNQLAELAFCVLNAPHHLSVTELGAICGASSPNQAWLYLGTPMLEAVSDVLAAALSYLSALEEDPTVQPFAVLQMLEEVITEAAERRNFEGQPPSQTYVNPQVFDRVMAHLEKSN